MFETDRSLRTGVMASIIASAVFIYFLDPILRSMARFLVYFYSFFGTKYIDRIYAQAAQLETINYAFILLIAFASLCCLTVLTRSTIAILRAFSTASDQPTKEHEWVRNVPKSKALSKGSAIMLLGITLCILLWVIAIMAGNWMQLSLTGSFRQHIRIVAPYIDTQQEKQLMSNWSRMRTQAEYRAIYERLSK